MISETLKALRKQKGVTAKTVAEDLNILPDTYRNYEIGRREPNLETLRAISDYFEVSADYLIGRNVPPPECLTESEKDLEACILEKYKQLPESYRKKFLQGVMEAVEIQKREQVTRETVTEERATQEAANDTVQIADEVQQVDTATAQEKRTESVQPIEKSNENAYIQETALYPSPKIARRGGAPSVDMFTKEEVDEYISRPRADEDM